MKISTFITQQGTGIEVTMIQFASFLLLVLSISSARSFAPRDTCPPKPPTVPEFNATSVRRKLTIFYTEILTKKDNLRSFLANEMREEIYKIQFFQSQDFNIQINI